MDAWLPVRLISVSPLTSAVSRVRLEGPRELSWGPGMHIALKDDPDAPVSYYSLASAVDAKTPGVFELAVGPDSTRFFQRNPKNTQLWMSNPKGGVETERLFQSRQVVLIGMGTGVAPLRSTAQWMAERQLEVPRALLAGFRTEDDCLFFEEFLADPALDFRPVLSSPAPGWKGLSGRVQNHLTDLPVTDTFYYVCGSAAMTKSVAHLLRERGVSESHLACEGY